jgi:hypothetical protein
MSSRCYGRARSPPSPDRCCVATPEPLRVVFRSPRQLHGFDPVDRRDRLLPSVEARPSLCARGGPSDCPACDARARGDGGQARRLPGAGGRARCTGCGDSLRELSRWRTGPSCMTTRDPPVQSSSRSSSGDRQSGPPRGRGGRLSQSSPAGAHRAPRRCAGYRRWAIPPVHSVTIARDDGGHAVRSVG